MERKTQMRTYSRRDVFETDFPGGFGYGRCGPGTYAAAARGEACEMGIRMALCARPWDVAWPPGYPPVAQPRSL